MAEPLDEREVIRVVTQLGNRIARGDSEALEDRIEVMLEDPETVLYVAALCLGNQLNPLGQRDGAGGAEGEAEEVEVGLSDDE